VLSWDLNIDSIIVGCSFTFCKNLYLSLAWQWYNLVSVLPKYLAKGQNILLSSYYSNVVLVVCTDELRVLSYSFFFIYQSYVMYETLHFSHPFTIYAYTRGIIYSTPTPNL
jgi:hypothetical protein